MKIIIAGTILLAFMEDSSGTIRLLSISLSVIGTTWIVKKITDEISNSTSQIIYFAGWSVAGVSMVQIIGKAINSMDKVTGGLTYIAAIVDRLTFWN